jgi:hypothetical protein
VKIFPRANQIGLTLLSFALLSGSLGVSPAGAVSGPNPSEKNSDSLFSSESLDAPESLGRIERDEVKAAHAHLLANAVEWGVDPLQFRATEAITVAGGMSVVRFNQFISGVEVANSLLAITVTSNGSLLSYTKSSSDYSASSQPPITQDQATDSIKKLLASANQIPLDSVAVSKIELVIVDDALVDGVPTGSYLAWRATTSISGDTTSLSMAYLSADGKSLFSNLPFVRGITADPFVCDLQIDITTAGYVLPTGVTADINNNRYINISAGNSAMPLCGLNTFGLGAPATEIGKLNISRTWDYFSTVLGQDINEEKYLGNISQTVNGDLTPRISAFVDICATNGTTGACPYGNAFWVPWTSVDCNSGACSGIFLGKNFDHADDVIAHELAHGVTFAIAFSAAMSDSSETAALSEAVSDIFGESMDQLSVTAGELPDPTWSMGEDAQAGGYRNLQKPNVAKIDKNWTPGDSHENSGPVNKLAYLLANGGKVGKVKIKPLGSVTKDGLCDTPDECTGIARMSQLVFATTSKLSASSNYFDFGKQMMISCNDFVTNKTTGFKKATCKNVAAALKAQGFTKFKITGLTKLGSVANGVETIITANVRGTTGAPVVGQEMSLQIKRGSKWKTVGYANTDGNGVVGFSATWTKSATYRIISKTNGGVFSATGKTAKVKVS